MRHRGRAVVFDSIEDFHARVDDADVDADVDADSVLAPRGRGPKGCPGMPEASNMPLPKKLLEQATLAGPPRRGWERLYVDHVLQADTGADLDFLVGSSGSEVTRESR
ncbi:hypothetical protein [Streptomyces spinosirectus]